MASILPVQQKWVSLRNGSGAVIGVHNIKLISTSDTFRVPSLASQNATKSSKQLERSNEPTVTVTASADADGAYRTITVVGTPGDDLVIVTMHQGMFDYGNDANIG